MTVKEARGSSRQKDDVGEKRRERRSEFMHRQFVNPVPILFVILYMKPSMFKRADVCNRK